MKILQVGSYPPPFGGQSVHIANLKELITRRGSTCTVFNTGQNKDIQESGVVNISSTLDLLKELFFTKNDIFHVHCGGPGTFYKVTVTWFVAKFLKKTRILTIHSGSFPGDLKKMSLIKRFLFSRILRDYDFLVAVNEKISSALLEIGVKTEKIKLIPAFSINVDLSQVNLSKEEETFLDDHDPLISCMGFFLPLYGLDFALTAIQTLKKEYLRIGLVVMATGKGKGLFLEEIKRKQCESNVLIIENALHEKGVSLISKSRLFLRPTLYDGDAISVREAMATGTDVIASDTDFRPLGVTLFPIGDVDALTEKIKAALCKAKTNDSLNTKIVDELNIAKVFDLYSQLGSQ